MKNKVILTADDYGVCNSIDKGIIEAVLERKITSVSAIVTHDTSKERMDILLKVQKEMRDKGFDFGIGLHFCITSGTPIYKVAGGPSSLADPDDPYDRFRKAKYYKFRDIKPHHLRQELIEQIARIKKWMGDEPIDHLTNHHGIVYFDKKMFNEYVQAAAGACIPIRSPMSWYRKFKKIGELPDYDNHDIGNPTMRQGLKLGMWRKLAQMSYGNFLERMEIAEELGVNYPDVLCEYIYGQCAEKIDTGDKVITHTLEKFVEQSAKQSVEDSQAYTIKKAQRGDLNLVVERYKKAQSHQSFSFELMFHLKNEGYAYAPIDELKSEDKPHGVNDSYFPVRERESITLGKFKLDVYSKDHNVNYIPYNKL